jgi:hypothetical protein
MHDTGTSSIVYVRYWYYQYCNITILVFLVLYSVTILVIPVSRPAASYYPKNVSKTNIIPESKAFNLSFMYIDDVLSINNTSSENFR